MSQLGKFIDISSLSLVATLTGDAGGAISPNGAGNIDILGSSPLTVTGVPASNSLTVSLSTVPVASGGTGATSLTDHGVLVGSGTGAVTALAVGTDGQVLLGSTGADPVFATLTSTGGTVAFTPGAGTLNLEATGAAGNFPDNTFYIYDDGDNSKKLAFQCSGITTSTTRTITMDDRDIDMDAVPTSVGSDSGSATPSSGSFSIIGGTDIATSGAGANITVSITGTTQYGLQVGDASGGIASLGLGTATQVLQSGGAGSNPAWSTATYPATTTQGDVLYSSADNTVAGLAKDATATRYLANTGASNNPQWDQVNLANGVTGTLPVGNGGTGDTTFTDHGVLVGSGASAITALGVGTTGQVLLGSSAADPAFGNPDFDDSIFSVHDNGDSSKLLAFQCSGITTSTTRTWTVDDRDIDFDAVPTSVGSDSGSATPAAGSFSIVGAGTVSTSASGSTITITGAGGGGLTWSEVTGTTQSAAADNGYVCNNAALVTVTLPSTIAVGKVVACVGKGAGMFKIAQNAGQTVYFGGSATTTGAGGSLTADIQYGAIEVVCITADTDFVVRSSIGNFTVV